MDLSSLDNTDDGQMSAGASAARAHHNAPKDPWNPHLGFGDLRGGGGDGSPEIIREYIEMEAYSPGVGFGEGLFDDEMSSGMDQNQEQSSPTDNVNVTGTESSPSLNENHDHEDESLEVGLINACRSWCACSSTMKVLVYFIMSTNFF